MNSGSAAFRATRSPELGGFNVAPKKQNNLLSTNPGKVTVLAYGQKY